MKTFSTTLATIISVALTFSSQTFSSQTYSSQTDAEQGEVLTSASTELKTVLIEATPISRVQPKYPAVMARKGMEGWVQLSFIIDKEGNTKDIKVLDSEGGRYFERQAIRSVEQWKYTPASADGEAIEQSQTQVQIDFNIGEQGVTPRFRKILMAGFTMLNNNDIDGLKDVITRLEEMEIKHNIERQWLNYFYSLYFHAMGDADKHFKFSKKTLPQHATIGKSSLLPPEQAVVVLQNIFIQQYKRFLLKDAQTTYAKLVAFEAPTAKDVARNLAPYNQKVTSMIADNATLEISGKISERNHWRYNLARNHFAIDSIEGDITQLDIRCDNKRNVYTVLDEASWHIPKSWGACQILVEGKPGTSFKLLELSPNS